MQKTNGFTAFTALAGGLTGAIAWLAVSHAGDRTVAAATANYAFLIAMIVIFSVSWSVLWAFCSVFFIKTFSLDPESEMAKQGMIFSAPLAAILILPVFFIFYPKLEALQLKVTGYVYVPFIHYVHFNAAGYALLSLLGLILLTVAGLLLYRFCMKLMDAGKSFDENKKARMVFAGIFIFLAVVTSYVTLVYPPTGDEPHFLTISQSMGRDFDLNLENNYTQGNYKEFYPVGIDYKSIHNTTDRHGRGIYSLHSIGLPALITVIQRATGRYGVQLFMNFLTALLAAVFYMLLKKNRINDRVSTALTCLIFATLPLMPASSLVLTEIPAALIVLYCVYRLDDFKPAKDELLMFLGLAFLPWLHPKLAVFSLVFYLWYYFAAAKHKAISLKKESINHAPLALSLVLMFLFYRVIYGSLPLAALQSIYVSGSFYFIFSLKHLLRAAAAMIFDRNFGLLPYNLLYVVSAWGVMLVAVKYGVKKLMPAFACLPYTALYFFWSDWGGSMYPARQLVPVAAVAGLYAAYFLQGTGFLKTKLFKFFAAYSLFVSFIMTAAPALRYVSGREKIYAVLLKTKFNLLWFFPSFSDIISFRHFIIAVYIAVIIILFFKYSGIEIKKKK